MARNLGVSALAGLAVGIEREWSGHASGPAARFAGARTFFLLGLLGGVAGWLTTGGLLALAALLLAGSVALTVAAYVMAARRSPADIEGTTEVAALVVLALGAVAGLGFPLLTSAALAVGALASALFKLCLALALGAGPFRRRAAAGIAAVAAACAVGLWIAG